jgi:hypothetical protein
MRSRRLFCHLGMVDCSEKVENEHGRTLLRMRPMLSSYALRLLLAFGRWRLGHGLDHRLCRGLDHGLGLDRLRRGDGLLLGRDLDGWRRLWGWLCARGGLIGFVCHRCYLPEKGDFARHVDLDF